MTQIEYRDLVKTHVEDIKDYLNSALRGERLDDIEPILVRMHNPNDLPNWFTYLKEHNGLPYGDGKTIGSIVEKLLVCIIEKYIFEPNSPLSLSVNPARGVDVPELNLGIKSPSENMCTSEPYFSAYERLLGNEFDVLVLLTNLQSVKDSRPIPLQIVSIRYLDHTEVADKNLCHTAKAMRDYLTDDEGSLQKVIRFLAYINQSDWEGLRILEIINQVLVEGSNLHSVLAIVKRKFIMDNRRFERDGKPLLDNGILQRLENIKTITPSHIGIIKAADDWVIRNQKDNGRFPNDNEWRRFLHSPLNGKISMSFALQWRYNFGPIFR